jgi:hypothetical protein
LYIDKITVDDVVLDCQTSIWFKTYLLDIGYDLGYFDGEGGQEIGETMTDEEALMVLHLESVM